MLRGCGRVGKGGRRPDTDGERWGTPRIWICDSSRRKGYLAQSLQFQKTPKLSEPSKEISQLLPEKRKTKQDKIPKRFSGWRRLSGHWHTNVKTRVWISRTCIMPCTAACHHNPIPPTMKREEQTGAPWKRVSQLARGTQSRTRVAGCAGRNGAPNCSVQLICKSPLYSLTQGLTYSRLR